MAAVANGVKNRLRGDRPADFLSWGPEFPLCSRSAGGENMHGQLVWLHLKICQLTQDIKFCKTIKKENIS